MQEFPSGACARGARRYVRESRDGRSGRGSFRRQGPLRPAERRNRSECECFQQLRHLDRRRLQLRLRGNCVARDRRITAATGQSKDRGTAVSSAFFLAAAGGLRGDGPLAAPARGLPGIEAAATAARARELHQPAAASAQARLIRGVPRRLRPADVCSSKADKRHERDASACHFCPVDSGGPADHVPRVQVGMSPTQGAGGLGTPFGVL
jgi:hypothetical protein